MKPTKLYRTLIKTLPILWLSGCSSLEFVNSLSKLYPVTVEQNLSFGSTGKLAYDLYQPKRRRTAQHETPVIVFVYGGSWNRGDKSEYEFVGRRLASLGYITAIPNYRLYPEVKYPEFLEDGAQAIKAITTRLKTKKYASLNPDTQIVVMGHSAGGYNAAMLAMDPRWLKAQGLDNKGLVKGFIGLAGAYNIYPIKDVEVQPVFNYPNYPSNSQPIDFATQEQAPSLILSPETDSLVNIEKNSSTLHRSLTQNGNRSELVTVKGTNHITLVGTLSPVLFFKGSSVEPIKRFVDSLYGETNK